MANPEMYDFGGTFVKPNGHLSHPIIERINVLLRHYAPWQIHVLISRHPYSTGFFIYKGKRPAWRQGTDIKMSVKDLKRLKRRILKNRTGIAEEEIAYEKALDYQRTWFKRKIR